MNDAFHGVRPSQEALPRVLVFSEGVISRSHGTGTIFQRNFAAYPPGKLANWFIGSSEEPLITSAVSFNPHRWPRGNFSPPTTLFAKFWNRFFSRVTGRKWCIPVNTAAITAAARAQSVEFDLVYAIVLTREGFDTLGAVLAGLVRPVPVILQIQDFFPHAHFGFWRAVRRLAEHVAEVWVVAPSIARAIAPHLPGKPILVDPLFNIAVPPVAKISHRQISADFRTVVLGNFWNPQLLDDLKAIWRDCRAELPGLPPVRWHCHPNGIARIRAAGFTPEPEIEPAPFLSGEDLVMLLQDTDLAIIPFSRGETPNSDYERFSLPSRITELAAVGVPVFCLTGADTPLYDYVTARAIGRCAPAADHRQAATALVELIRDQAGRTALGTAARTLAENEFPIALQQARIYGNFSRIAFSKSS